MDPSKLLRGADKVHACLKELPNDKLMALKEVQIMIPVRFAERGLASVGLDTQIVGHCVYIVENKYYAISLTNARLKIKPTATEKVDIRGDQYYLFTFEAGSTVVEDLQLVKVDTLVYRVYDEMLSKGNIPWYINYLDLMQIFDSAPKHAGANVGRNREVIELLVSLIARDPKDRTRYYRTAINDITDVTAKPPIFTPVKSVRDAATNTTNKLIGSYFTDATVAALVSPAQRTERIEALLRA